MTEYINTLNTLQIMLIIVPNMILLGCFLTYKTFSFFKSIIFVNVLIILTIGTVLSINLIDGLSLIKKHANTYQIEYSKVMTDENNEELTQLNEATYNELSYDKRNKFITGVYNEFSNYSILFLNKQNIQTYIDKNYNSNKLNLKEKYELAEKLHNNKVKLYQQKNINHNKYQKFIKNSNLGDNYTTLSEDVKNLQINTNKFASIDRFIYISETDEYYGVGLDNNLNKVIFDARTGDFLLTIEDNYKYEIFDIKYIKDRTIVMYYDNISNGFLNGDIEFSYLHGEDDKVDNQYITMNELLKEFRSKDTSNFIVEEIKDPENHALAHFTSFYHEDMIHIVIPYVK